MSYLDIKNTDILKIFDTVMSNPIGIFSTIILGIIAYYPVLNKINVYRSLSDFDALFIPKHEVFLRKVINTMATVLSVLLAYLYIGCLIAIGLNFLQSIEYIKEILGFLVFGILCIYGVTTLPFILYNFLSALLKQDNIKKLNKHKQKILWETIFNVNLALSFFIEAMFIFSFLQSSTLESFFTIIAIIIYPIFIFYLLKNYKSKAKKKIEYYVQIISKEEFNNSKVIMSYTLDTDRLVFINKKGKKRKKGNDDYYIYDRANDKYFKYTPVPRG